MYFFIYLKLNVDDFDFWKIKVFINSFDDIIRSNKTYIIYKYF